MRLSRLFGLALVVTAAISVQARSAEPIEIHAAPKADVVRADLVQWLQTRQVSDSVLDRLETVWPAEDVDLPAREVLDRLVAVFGFSDPDARAFVSACDVRSERLLPPEPDFLDRPEHAPFFANNMRLYYARFLTQRRMYDEALEQFDQLDPDQIVDPASCLFFRAVCEQQLLMKTEGLATIKSLLSDTEEVPVSYSTVGQLMQYQLEALEEESLDEVALLMRDVERRLDLGRGGHKVQKQEDRVIAVLDKIIEKLEQQQGGGGGGGGGNANNQSNQSSSPANDSRIKGSTAPGDVDERDLGQGNGWGALDDKEAEQVKNILNKKFPSHYRQAVEEYLKKLAKKHARE